MVYSPAPAPPRRSPGLQAQPPRTLSPAQLASQPKSRVKPLPRISETPEAIAGKEESAAAVDEDDQFSDRVASAVDAALYLDGGSGGSVDLPPERAESAAGSLNTSFDGLEHQSDSPNSKELHSKKLLDPTVKGLDDLFYISWLSQNDQPGGQSAADFAAGLVRGDTNKLLVCLSAVYKEMERSVADVKTQVMDMKALRESFDALQQRVQNNEEEIEGEKLKRQFAIQHAVQHNLVACKDVEELKKRLEHEMGLLQTQCQVNTQLVEALDSKIETIAPMLAARHALNESWSAGAISSPSKSAQGRGLIIPGQEVVRQTSMNNLLSARTPGVQRQTSAPALPLHSERPRRHSAGGVSIVTQETAGNLQAGMAPCSPMSSSRLHRSSSTNPPLVSSGAAEGSVTRIMSPARDPRQGPMVSMTTIEPAAAGVSLSSEPGSRRVSPLPRTRMLHTVAPPNAAPASTQPSECSVIRMVPTVAGGLSSAGEWNSESVNARGSPPSSTRSAMSSRMRGSRAFVSPVSFPSRVGAGAQQNCQGSQ